MTRLEALALAAVLALGTAHTAYAADTWINVAKNNVGSAWDAKAQSGELSAAGNFIVIERFRPSNGNDEYVITTVSLAECARGFGGLKVYTLAGVYRFQNDFVLGGETVSDGRARAYCGVAKDLLTDNANASPGNI